MTDKQSVPLYVKNELDKFLEADKEEYLNEDPFKVYDTLTEGSLENVWCDLDTEDLGTVQLAFDAFVLVDSFKLALVKAIQQWQELNKND